MKSWQLRRLVESALLLAMGVVLSMVKIFELPNGGSITAMSMLPVLLISLRHGTRWGLFSAVTYSLLQMLLGFYPPPAQTLWAFVLVIVLDYLVAFGGLGLAKAFAVPFGGANKAAGLVAAVGLPLTLRFLCHFVSGIVIWDIYAPPGVPVWLFSLQYNGSYMLGETILTTVAVLLLRRYIVKTSTVSAGN